MGGIAPSQVGSADVRGVPAGGMARVATGAAALMAGQAALVKVIAALGQVLLSWFLFPEDMGLIALATTVISMVGLLQQGGVRQVLVHRQRAFGVWSTPAFWLSLAMGLIALGVAAAVAPLAAQIYNEPALVGLILVMALGMPIDALQAVPMARLQVDLRFKAIALVLFGMAAGAVALSVVLAWLGFGAYSVVLPKIPLGLMGLAAMWWLTRVPVRRRPMFRRWRFMLGDSALVVATLALYAAGNAAVSFVLGRSGRTDDAGLYFWAYVLSLQTILVFSQQLDPVLFASLSKLAADRARQMAGFVRSMRALAMIVVPLSLLQAAAAEPLVRLIFAERWHAGIACLQILSVGMAFSAVSIPSASMLQAQGRFRAQFLCALAGLTLLVGMLIALRGRPIEWLAGAYAAYAAASSIVHLVAIAWSGGGGAWAVASRAARALAPGMAIGIIAGGAGLAASFWIDGPAWMQAVRLAVCAVVGVAAWVLAARALDPAALDEIKGLGGGMTTRAIGAIRGRRG
ncbi:oligosaccharide flippase family protein [Leptolyngbya sp. 15MV]|nr:oligosaccharide flippase family protein [Leptolyngbya sp. 15MV]